MLNLSVQTLSLLLVAGYFSFLLLSLVRRGPSFSGPWLFLLRSFFPNWRFYHGFGVQPRLFIRTADIDGQWSDWQMHLPRAHFSLSDLVHNPDNNLALANQNLIDHLSFDVQTLPEGGDVRRLVTYRMVTLMARELLAKQGSLPPQWQFRLSLVPPLQSPTDDMTLLLSPVMEG